MFAVLLLKEGMYAVRTMHITSLYDSIDVASACPSFTSSVEEGRAVCPGEELDYTCTIFDDTGTSSTEWILCGRGTLVVVHSTLGGQPVDSGNFSAILTASNSDCYTSTLTVTASPELNGAVIICRDSLENVAGNTTILLRKSTPSRF